MTTELLLTRDPISETALRAGRTVGSGAGAVIAFVGVVRGQEGETAIAGLEYTAFEPMVHHQFSLLFAEAGRRWPVDSIRLVHRLGWVPVGEPSLWLELVCPHRGEAFAACQWLIDEMKRVVPIWKAPRATK